MKPGLYTLLKDVAHPNTGYYTVDKRRKDWRYAEKWSAGTKCVVTQYRDHDTERMLSKYGEPIPEGGCTITSIHMGEYSHQNVKRGGAGAEIFAALQAALVEHPDETKSWMASEGLEPHHLSVLVTRLVAGGKLQLDDLKEAYKQYRAEEE